MQASVEFAARRAQAAEQRRQILEMLRDEVPHVADDLPHAGRREQPRIERFATLPREQFGPDDHVHATRFVFERHEHHALRGARHLPRDHEPACACEPAVEAIAQLGRGRQPLRAQRRPQQRDRVAIQREAGGVIVGEDVVGFRRCAERGLLHLVDRRGGEQVALRRRGDGLPQRIAAMAGERRERVRGGERFEIAPFELRAPGEAVDVVERAGGAGGFDAARSGFAKTAHERQAEPHGRLAVWRRLIGQRFERGLPVALRDVDRQHLHAMTLRVLHELRRRVEAHRLAVQQRGEEDRRFVALEPAARVREFRETGRMAFGKTVFAEALDLLEDLLGEFARVVAFEHPADDLVLIFLEIALALPCGHRATQVVRFARRKTCGDDRDLHHLFLEDRHTQRANEHFLERVARIRDLTLLFAGHDPAPLQIRMHRAALNRAGPHDRHLDHEIVIVARPQPRQHRHLRTRFDLEHTDGIGAADHVVGCFVILRNVFQRKRFAVRLRRPAPRGAQVERAMQRRQHAEREHVDLHQPERLEIVLVPLDHAPPVHRRVLDRHEPRELAAADHEAARMLRQVTREVEQAPRQFGPCANQRRFGIEPGRRELLQQIAAAVEPAMPLRDPIDQHRVDAERLAGFAQHAARTIRRNGGRERGAVVPVFFVDMLDHFFPALMLEIDVDMAPTAYLPMLPTKH